MRVYLATVYTSRFDQHGRVYGLLTDAERKARDDAKHFLESFYYLDKQPETVEAIRRDGVRIFCDSGAYSAKTQHEKIDLTAYCRFIHEHEDIIEQVDGRPLVAVLDVIGDARATRHNHVEMQKQGVKPIPVFHFGSDVSFLQEYVANFDYVGLGGLVRKSPSRQKEWLDRMLNDFLLDGAGRLRCRVHAFGMTSLELLKRYRNLLTSVDSTTWRLWAGNGMLLMPRGQVSISNDSADVGQHFDSFGTDQQQDMLETIERAGFEVDRLRKHYFSRWTWNAVAFQNEG
jgi:hypothetical protein